MDAQLSRHAAGKSPAWAPKPCPHCGGHRLHVSRFLTDSAVECLDCGSAGPLMDTREAAKAAWNDRQIETHYVEQVKPDGWIVQADRMFTVAVVVGLLALFWGLLAGLGVEAAGWLSA